MRAAALLALVALAACGADGPPERVATPQSEALRVDATASIGVTGSF